MLHSIVQPSKRLCCGVGVSGLVNRQIFKTGRVTRSLRRVWSHAFIMNKVAEGEKRHQQPSQKQQHQRANSQTQCSRRFGSPSDTLSDMSAKQFFFLTPTPQPLLLHYAVSQLHIRNVSSQSEVQQPSRRKLRAARHYSHSATSGALSHAHAGPHPCGPGCMEPCDHHTPSS